MVVSCKVTDCMLTLPRVVAALCVRLALTRASDIAGRCGGTLSIAYDKLLPALLKNVGSLVDTLAVDPVYKVGKSCWTCGLVRLFMLQNSVS
jgi:hypothetical protein